MLLNFGLREYKSRNFIFVSKLRPAFEFNLSSDTIKHGTIFN